MASRIINLSIERPWRAVYAFASDPAHLPQWAAGLANGLRQDGEEWIASGPIGNVRVKFAARNDYGVIDHSVTLPGGLTVYNAFRVTPNGDGAEVAFTLMKLPGMSDADFERDAAMVYADLERLKALIESE